MKNNFMQGAGGLGDMLSQSLASLGSNKSSLLTPFQVYPELSPFSHNTRHDLVSPNTQYHSPDLFASRGQQTKSMLGNLAAAVGPSLLNMGLGALTGGVAPAVGAVAGAAQDGMAIPEEAPSHEEGGVEVEVEGGEIILNEEQQAYIEAAPTPEEKAQRYEEVVQMLKQRSEEQGPGMMAEDGLHVSGNPWARFISNLGLKGMSRRGPSPFINPEAAPSAQPGPLVQPQRTLGESTHPVGEYFPGADVSLLPPVHYGDAPLPAARPQPPATAPAGAHLNEMATEEIAEEPTPSGVSSLLSTMGAPQRASMITPTGPVADTRAHKWLSPIAEHRDDIGEAFGDVTKWGTSEERFDMTKFRSQEPEEAPDDINKILGKPEEVKPPDNFDAMIAAQDSARKAGVFSSIGKMAVHAGSLLNPPSPSMPITSAPYQAATARDTSRDDQQSLDQSFAVMNSLLSGMTPQERVAGMSGVAQNYMAGQQEIAKGAAETERFNAQSRSQTANQNIDRKMQVDAANIQITRDDNDRLSQNRREAMEGFFKEIDKTIATKGQSDTNIATLKELRERLAKMTPEEQASFFSVMQQGLINRRP